MDDYKKGILQMILSMSSILILAILHDKDILILNQWVFLFLWMVSFCITLTGVCNFAGNIRISDEARK